MEPGRIVFNECFCNPPNRCAWVKMDLENFKVWIVPLFLSLGTPILMNAFALLEIHAPRQKCNFPHLIKNFGLRSGRLEGWRIDLDGCSSTTWKTCAQPSLGLKCLKSGKFPEKMVKRISWREAQNFGVVLLLTYAKQWCTIKHMAHNANEMMWNSLL